MRTVAIVQARMGSLRLPGKVLSPIEGQSAIKRLLSRLGMAESLDEIILATTKLSEDDRLAGEVTSLGINVFRGEDQDVLSRYLEAASIHNASMIVRVTGDCPLIDPSVLDEVVALAKKSQADYCSNVEPPTYPNGLDVEVFPQTSLVWADKMTTALADREHVTTALRKSKEVNRINLSYREDYSAERWTLDTREDLEVIRNIFREFSGSNSFSWLEVLSLAIEKPDLFASNRHLIRNHGSTMTAEEKIELAEKSTQVASSE